MQPEGDTSFRQRLEKLRDAHQDVARLRMISRMAALNG